VTREQVERLLNTYSLDELLELNDTDLETCILFLIQEGVLAIPELAPLDTEDETSAEYYQEVENE
jgi:hypothetical protein